MLLSTAVPDTPTTSGISVTVKCRTTVSPTCTTFGVPVNTVSTVNRSAAAGVAPSVSAQAATAAILMFMVISLPVLPAGI